MSLLEMLNEPGQRQGVIAGAAGVAGFCVGTYRVLRDEGPLRRITSFSGDELPEISREGTRYLGGVSALVVGGVGFEKAATSDTLILDSAIAEATTDMGVAYLGFQAGAELGYVVGGFACIFLP